MSFVYELRICLPNGYEVAGKYNALSSAEAIHLFIREVEEYLGDLSEVTVVVREQRLYPKDENDSGFSKKVYFVRRWKTWHWSADELE